MPGITAIPGLIDAHVHMVLDPEIRDRWHRQPAMRRPN
jgi:imidazolonepropionase-like amidohydrolase